jgi:hypothetical protein
VLDKQEDEALENTNGKRPLLRFFALVDKVQLLLLYRKETFHPLLITEGQWKNLQTGCSAFLKLQSSKRMTLLGQF